MRSSARTWVLVFVAATGLGCGRAGAAEGPAALPGRQVKVSAIAIGFGGHHDQKLALALEHLQTAGHEGVDIACLPEEFAGTVAEPIPGPTTQAVTQLAKQYKFWPSAYGGGMPLNGYAMIHNYYVVAVGRGNMIDLFGKTIDGVQKPRPRQFIATLDLDRTLIHTNFNGDKVARLLKEHRGEVVQEQFLDMESWYVLRSVKPGVRVRDLCRQYQIETLREYRHRSREQINAARAKDQKI